MLRKWLAAWDWVERRTRYRGRRKRVLRGPGPGRSAPGRFSRLEQLEPRWMMCWTVMVYLDADNNLEPCGIYNVNQMESVGSTADMNILVQFDRIPGYDSSNGDWTDTRRARIVHDSDPDTISSTFTSIGEADMGDPNTLRNFIQWGVSQAPADNYLLVLWNHGGGLSGVCWDDTNSSDNLTVREARQAIAASGAHLSVVGFDACVMSMEEVAYEVQPYANVMVGSQKVEPGNGWPYDTILTDLAANPHMTATQLGATITQRYGESFYGEETQSAMDLSQEPALAAALDQFANAAINCAEWGTISAARADAASFSYDDYRDLGSFLQNVAAQASDVDLRTAAASAYGVYEATIVANHSGPGDGGTGLTIYLPGQGESIEADYTASGFQFLNNTHWRNFLVNYTTDAAALRIHVTGSTPAQGSQVAAAPTDYTVDFNYAYDPASVQARDLTVNSHPADSVAVVDADTLRFHFNSAPAVAVGNYTMTMSAGAVRATGTGGNLLAWSAGFRIGVADIGPLPAALSAQTTVDGSSSVALDISNVGNSDLQWAATTGQYTLVDSDYPGGPAYSWIDLTTTGTPLAGLGDETNLGPYNLGFSFPFYGQDFRSFQVCSNGWLSFSDTGTAYENTLLPDPSAPANLVAFLWDDLDFSAGGAAYYRQIDAGTMVVEFVDVPFYGSNARATCETILKADGSITFQYQHVDRVNGATVGIQDATGSHALLVCADDPSYLHDNMAVTITRSGQWLSLSSASGTLAPGGSSHPTVQFNAAGLAPGIYETVLTVASNDPDEALVQIPVTLTVVALPDNHFPTGLVLSDSTVQENQPAGALVGWLTGVDPDASDTFTYALVSGAGDGNNAAFTIEGNELLTAAPLDFETTPVCTIRVQVTDQGGLSYTEALTITVQDVHDITTPGLFDPVHSTFYLRNSNDTGVADYSFGYGAPNSPWIPLIGDWNGDGVDTIGFYDPQASVFFLRDSNDAGYADHCFAFGAAGAGWTPVVGDWNGDGIVTVGLFDRAHSVFYLRNTLDTGCADYSFGYGAPNSPWITLMGDWNGDGRDTVGFFDPSESVFFLRNSNDVGCADYCFGYGIPHGNWTPIVGDWDGNHTTTVGFFDAATGMFYLRNSLSAGVADVAFPYGAAGQGWVPLVGCWNSDPEPMAARVGAPAATLPTLTGLEADATRRLDPPATAGPAPQALDPRAVDQIDLRAVAARQLSTFLDADDPFDRLVDGPFGSGSKRTLRAHG